MGVLAAGQGRRLDRGPDDMTGTRTPRVRTAREIAVHYQYQCR